MKRSGPNTAAAVIITVFLSFYIQQANAQGISFNEDLTWEEVKTKAKSENKYIFIDAMATWCGPCKAMEQSVYTSAAVGEFFNKNFVSVKLQTDKTPADPESVKKWYPVAEKLASSYKVNALPSLIFLTPDGKLASKIAGYRDAETLVADAKLAMQPEKQYCQQIEQYTNGKKDPDFIAALAKHAEDLGRKIMAQKIRGTDPFAKYAVTSIKPLPGFAGVWEIDYPKSEFGELPLHVAPKQVIIGLEGGQMKIARLTKDNSGQENTAVENISLDGKYTASTSKSGRTKSSRMVPGENKEGLIELSEFSFPENSAEVEYVVTEEWSLSTDGTMLTIRRTVDDGEKPYTVVGVYNRK